MRLLTTWLFPISMISSMAACGGGSSESPAPATPAGAAAPATFVEQVTAGQRLYGAKCASCHGPGGEGAKAPRLVGLDKGALPLDPPAGAKARKTRFKTAADVAGFVVPNMPPGDLSLKEQDYWAILAFDLHANGVDLPYKIDASNAAGVVLHK